MHVGIEHYISFTQPLGGGSNYDDNIDEVNITISAISMIIIIAGNITTITANNNNEKKKR